MTTNLAEKFPDRESPTTPIPDAPSRMLVFASRIDRLAHDALDRIRSDGDAEGAAILLVQIQAITAEVCR